jgi:tetratricopeptide (TPR) repeat protein
MASSSGERLGQQLLPDLLRDIASRELTGVLRLSRDTTTRSLVFERGRPINAFSSIPSEQIDSRLVKDGRTTTGLVSSVKRAHPDPMTLGAALVEKGLVSADSMHKAAQDLGVQIALSLFEWRGAEPRFEEGDVHCPCVIELTAADLIAQGVRNSAKTPNIANSIAPLHKLAESVQVETGHFANSARLTSLESYILSVLCTQAKLQDVVDMTGLPVEEVQATLCVLAALGLIALTDPPATSKKEEVDESLRDLLQGIQRKLQFFESANYYQILGVDKLATTSAINEAFTQIQQMFQSYAAEYPDNIDLKKQLALLFNKIRAAHETLGDPLKRSQYDRPLGGQPPPNIYAPTGYTGAGARTPVSDGVRIPSSVPSSSPAGARKPIPIPVQIPDPVRPKSPPSMESVIERGQTPPPPAKPAQPPARKPIPIPEIQMPVAPQNGNGRQIERGQADNVRRIPPAPPRAPAMPLTRPPAVLSPEEASRLSNPGIGNTIEQALHFYRQGRTRFDRREIDAAEHLFREAVRLDPSQSNYHYYLAVVLAIRAQARHEHMHHEGCHVTCKLGGSLVSNPKVRYEAEQHFLRASEIDPTNPQIPLKLGQLYKEARLLKKAEHYLKQALMLDSKNSIAQHELNTLHDVMQEDEVEVEF